MVNIIDLKSRVAVVTGGGSGIGAASALLFAQHGADVAICGRTAETLEKTATKIEAATGKRCLAIPCDVRIEEHVQRLIDTTVRELGRIDILVNNAGGSRLAPLADLTPHMWDRSFQLNVDAPYFCTREAGKHFLAQKSGAIVNVSSLAGIGGTKRGAHYSAAKAALQMFTRVAAAEWGPHGIRVNCVAAGVIASENAIEGWKAAGLDSKEMAASLPLGRVGRPEEVANAIVFLCSDAASYISGEILAVGGGPSMGGQA
jgi:NAD(P)-dependent dehydrogenase (short-subunit alcohol dehydrogenase family)